MQAAIAQLLAAAIEDYLSFLQVKFSLITEKGGDLVLADILKQRRLALGLTQQAVAEKLHVTRQAVSSWENGKSYPDIPSLIAISDFYALSLDYMLKGDIRYVRQIEADTKEFQVLKKIKLTSYTLLALLPFFLLLGLTVSDKDTLLWQLLYWIAAAAALLLFGRQLFLIRQSGKLKLRIWLPLTFAFLLNIAKDFFTIPLVGFMIYGCFLVALAAILIEARQKSEQT